LEFFFAGKAVFKLISLFKKKLIQVNEKLALTVFLLILSFESFPQKSDSKQTAHHFNGSVTLTTNGISTIPNFILGKPAVVYLFVIRGKNY